MSNQRFPPGWDGQRVRDVIAHYENQSEDEQFAEIEAAREEQGITMMAVPNDLAPEVRALIARRMSEETRRLPSRSSDRATSAGLASRQARQGRNQYVARTGSRNQYVIRSGKEWAVRAEGADKLTSRHATQGAAIAEAREIARHQGSAVRIQGRDGKFRDADSHGHDPCPPKDTR